MSADFLALEAVRALEMAEARAAKDAADAYGTPDAEELCRLHDASTYELARALDALVAAAAISDADELVITAAIDLVRATSASGSTDADVRRGLDALDAALVTRRRVYAEWHHEVKS